jgi:hypothetical protein
MYYHRNHFPLPILRCNIDPNVAKASFKTLMSALGSKNVIDILTPIFMFKPVAVYILLLF